MSFRVGHGYDVHRFEDGRPLWLGGVHIKDHSGLAGHSDADVLLHAIIDAILGAASLPDIGTIFPDSSAEFKDISSSILLSRTASLVSSAGYKIVNIDATIIAETPKIAPYITDMRAAIANAAGISPQDVNIKATTKEGLGFTGARLGIAAHAVCLLKAYNLD
jgi:2-C-methyl-D-erythritol 2,4-cyclodiphosphate synthase